MNINAESVFKDTSVARHLSGLHDKYIVIVVPVDKAPNNIVCKSHNVEFLIKESGVGNSFGNPAYTPTTLTEEEILDNHRSNLFSFGISTK